MFELDQFIADCRAALTSDAPHKAVREVVARAVSEPAAVLRALGEPRRAELRAHHPPRLGGERAMREALTLPGGGLRAANATHGPASPPPESLPRQPATATGSAASAGPRAAESLPWQAAAAVSRLPSAEHR